MIVSDATGYLQASGRTSRMYAGGLSKGLSIVLVDERRAFKHLIKKVNKNIEGSIKTCINNCRISK